MANISDGLPAVIHLETTITQQGEQSQHLFDVSGKVVKMGEAIYIRYKEISDELPEPVPVMIKIMPEEIQITRAAESHIKLHFRFVQLMTTEYKTPYGKMQIATKTTHQTVMITNHPYSGEIALDYLLYSGGQEVGSYKLRLLFTV